MYHSFQKLFTILVIFRNVSWAQKQHIVKHARNKWHFKICTNILIILKNYLKLQQGRMRSGSVVNSHPPCGHQSSMCANHWPQLWQIYSNKKINKKCTSCQFSDFSVQDSTMIVTSAFKTETDLRHKPVQQRPTWSKTHMWLFLCCSELNISTALTDSEWENAEEKEIKRRKSEAVIKERWIKPDRSTHNQRQKEHSRRKRTEGEKTVSPTVSLNLLTAKINSIHNSFHSCNKMSKIKLKQDFHKSFTKSRGA